MRKKNARSIATQVLTQVIGYKHSLSDCLDTALPSLNDARDRALAQALCYGVLRWLPRLQALLQRLLRKPFKAKDSDIEVLLLIGLYQQLYMRIPDHAAIAATVDVTRTLKKPWATGLVNGVLRHFQRQQKTLLMSVDNDNSAKLAHPPWLLERLIQDYPKDWEAIVEANNTHPPLTLRVNARLMSRDDYLEHLRVANMGAVPTPYTEYGITLEQIPQGMPNSLPGFTQGWASVQDGAAQLAAPLLDVPIGARVLDACAAPGGKTAHLLEHYNIDALLALDNQPARVQKLTDTLHRLQLLAEVRLADASQPETWWDGEPFDRILLDVPCSGSGVIRRHPDIKYLRRSSDIKKLAAQQKRLLGALWKLLKPGGKLLYITCSVFAEENHLQIQNWLTSHADANETVISADWGHAMAYGRQILPGENNHDGFYYACLSKTK
ncbi:MAG: 16S rRNA (cytosine(967)-C(5))-methyltransferase [Gammaproteobacteria bacterium]|nr:MAG: 16S rRNA (cytosine(967)-C(5))-methyltransferase [Gammaproteobacteria bacterium]